MFGPISAKDKYQLFSVVEFSLSTIICFKFPSFSVFSLGEMAVKGREEKEHVNLINVFCDLIKRRDMVTR